jgi:hypothetical protein
MSIAKLKQIARLDLPHNVSNDDEIDELRVLMAAGLITGLSLRIPKAWHSVGGSSDPRGMFDVVRILAITPDGRRLLRRHATGGG